MGIWLKPFDATREFVTQGPFRANGIAWGPGFPFDKSTVDVRTLARLYDQHKIIYDDDPKAIRLLSRSSETAPPAVPLINPVPIPLRKAPKPQQPEPAKAEGDSELDRVRHLMSRFNKPDLLTRAADIPGVDAKMSKQALATLLVRHGRDS
jgi:hypothetical protein